MDPDFWHDRWQENRTGFHQDKPHRLLVDHFETLNLPKGGRVCLPLCGKTRDIAWLLAQGCHVIGAELSRLAIDQLFEDLGVTPEVTELGPLTRMSADGIDIYVGDIFDLTQDTLGPVDATYDRAALIALPADMRVQYAAHLTAITAKAPQLVITLQYDQGVINGPPFSVIEDELRSLYSASYTLTRLARDTEAGVKGHPATEEIWHLHG